MVPGAWPCAGAWPVPYLLAKRSSFLGKPLTLLREPRAERPFPPPFDEAHRSDGAHEHLCAVGVHAGKGFSCIVEGMGRMATGAWTVLPVWPVFLFLAGVLGALPLLVRSTNKALMYACSKEGVTLSTGLGGGVLS